MRQYWKKLKNYCYKNVISVNSKMNADESFLYNSVNVVKAKTLNFFSTLVEKKCRGNNVGVIMEAQNWQLCVITLEEGEINFVWPM